ncbi:MAG: hypothetical protein CMO81_00660 [Waddliaceae bacterium]|nr:hypothetical protein [Waddliaceae bacterium]
MAAFTIDVDHHEVPAMVIYVEKKQNDQVSIDEMISILYEENIDRAEEAELLIENLCPHAIIRKIGSEDMVTKDLRRNRINFLTDDPHFTDDSIIVRFYKG